MTKISKKTKDPSLRFVVQEHQASHHHYDFRLEKNGVLKSWAIPKGPSMNPAEKRLAIPVPDHTLEYADYEGIIPVDSYGAGPVVKWDTGTYQLLEGENPLKELKGGKLVFALKGKKLKGGFTLRPMRMREKMWLLIKMKDDKADSQWVTRSILEPARIKKLKIKVPPCEGH